MLILLDVDNTVVDTLGAALRASGCALSREAVADYDLSKTLSPIEWERVKSAFNSMRFWETLEPLPYATECIKAMQYAGHEIVWVTASWSSCIGHEFAKRRLLKKLFGVHPDNIIFTRRKELVRGSLFIDDQERPVREWAALNGSTRALLSDMPFNQHVTGLRRFSWRRLLDGQFADLFGGFRA